LNSNAPIPSSSPDRPDFSLVLGGPLFQLFRRAHLTGDALEMSNRRVIIAAGSRGCRCCCCRWCRAMHSGDSVAIPFLQDVEAHVRFLIALPILIAAELIVHRRLSPAVRQFVERRIVSPKSCRSFNRQSIRPCACATRCGSSWR
jgi:hypothetical protein